MFTNAPLRSLAGLALVGALCTWSASAQEDREIKHVFVIALENHDWTQPATVPGGIQPISQNPNAPFINSLVNGTAVAYINGRLENISQHVAYATDTYMYMYIYMCMYIHVYIHLYIYIYHIYLYTYIFIYLFFIFILRIFIYMYIYAYIYTYIYTV